MGALDRHPAVSRLTVATGAAAALIAIAAPAVRSRPARAAGDDVTASLSPAELTLGGTP
jgi:hypothetical protein